MHENVRYLLELLDTTARTIERQAHRIEQANREDIETLRLMLHELKEIRRSLEPCPPTSTASITNLFSGDVTVANNALVFNVGQTSTDTVTPLLADGVTPSGGVVSNLAVTFSDPSATAAVSGANTILFTGVAPSTGAISGSVSCTVTDTDGVVSTWTQAFTVTTSAVAPPPAQLTQSVANVFSTPLP
jgi:hypothetical protein